MAYGVNTGGPASAKPLPVVRFFMRYEAMSTLRRGLLIGLIAAASAACATTGSAPYAGSTQYNTLMSGWEKHFMIDWTAAEQGTSARTVSGYVYNQRAGYRAERMQLSIERLDAAGKVIGTSSTWVLGGVPPGSRAFFSARVEPAASYRVQVLSFEWTQTQRL